MIDFYHERESMVTAQLVTRNVRDRRVLEAMRKVERHQFVPSDKRHLAYQDSPLPIGEGQTISQPYIVALMTEHLGLQGHEKVLEIGTGSGYQTAILAELAAEVYTIELAGSLAERAGKLLGDLGYHNVHVLCADGYEGWRDQAPFDGIIVTCAPSEVPGNLVDQLAGNGRLVVPVGAFEQDLFLVRKVNGQLVSTNIAPVRFVPMVRKLKEEE